MGMSIGIGLGLSFGGGAAAPPIAPAVRETISAIGDSWTDGNVQEISRDGTIINTDRWTNQLATALAVSESLTPGQAGWTTGVINVGYGGATTATINTNHAAIVTADSLRAGDIAIIGPGKNNTSTAAGVADTLAGVDLILARLTSERKIIWVPRGAAGANGTISAEPLSTLASWVRGKRIHWAYRETARRPYLFELDRWYQGLSPNGSDGSATDDLDSAQYQLITSLKVAFGATADDHPNYITAPMWVDGFEPVVLAMMNHAVHTMDATIPAPWDMAAGTKLEVYFKGYVTSASISTDDPTNGGLFTIAMKAGSTSTAELTRTSTSDGNIPAILNLKVTGNGVDTTGAPCTASVGDIRIVPTMEGASNTVPRGVTLPRDTIALASSRRWPLMASETAPFAAAPALSIFVGGLRFGAAGADDATTMTVLSINSTRVLIQRNAANKLAIRLQDASGVDLMNWATLVTNFTFANAPLHLMISYDYNGGAPVAKVWEWHGGAATDIAPATGFGAGVTNIGMAQHLHLFNTGNAQVTFKGGLKSVWMDDRYIDWSSSTERDKFFNSSTGALVDLGTTGTVDAIQPNVYLAGEPGDFMKGTNFGSGPEFGFNDNWLLGFTGNSSDPGAY